jgi:uncharacterized protein (DUF1778 family)
VKTAQLQVRVSPSEKEALRRRARAAGLGISEFVLSRLLPPAGERFAGILAALRAPGERRFALAELNDLLADLAPQEFGEALADAPPSALGSATLNRVAAMVEQAAAAKGVPPPAWAASIPPLEEPDFASDLRSLRAHLLRSSPAAFRRRNLFVDAGVGDRV